MMPLNWEGRKWNKANTWGDTLDLELLHEKVNTAIIEFIAAAYGNEVKC